MRADKIFNSIFYFLFLSSITLYIWINHLDFIGMGIFVLVSFFVLVFVKNTIHAFPYFFNMLFMISQTEWSLESIPIFLYALPIILAIGFIIHYIRFRDEWFKGILTKPMLLMFVAMALSIFNSQILDLNFVFYLVIGSFYVLLYVFFIQTIKGDQVEYIIKLFVVLGLMISLQILIYYMNSGDIAEALRSDRVNLGWGISNFAATYLIMFISATIYYVKTKPQYIFFSIVLAFEILMLIFTLSRGGVLSFIALMPLLIYYLYHGQKNKLYITLYILITLIILVTVFIVRTDFFLPLFERFKDLDFKEGNGRVELWIQAYHKFLEYPLVGAGLFARVEGDYFGFYHNTFMHTLASLGLVGMISLLWQIIVVSKLFLRKINLKKSILLIILLGANIHGMVDNVYFMPHFMVIFFAIVAVVEVDEHERLNQPYIWRLSNVKK
ncbi:O-antigen ligase family protein [Hujiaoplasma nucleasis]|uniref:O-antigen ligase family protein n=1 Tax=Hujiaoplasma nucleasis TaxID=2725268 RepID=A0A7L6N4I3_9MOLU|nr:O-antigen ligase family protein [Hujiaoplasma nucleasis]QLY39489.1 O-antigen ligase family protein [Hujiaoplasma nucleasis]